MDLDLMKQLAKALTAQFGEKCEVVVHDLKNVDSEHTIVAIENGHVSQRELGDGPSRVVLEALKHKEGEELEDMTAYLTKTNDGRILKSSTVFMRDAEGKIEGVFSINYDITELLMAESAVASLLNYKKDKPAQVIPQSVNELLDDLIEQSVDMVGKPVAMMTKNDKIKAIRFLNDSGAFLVTKSGDKVAKYFGISKYTLYSYMDVKREED